ncbi:hypothetical protein D6D54_02455 [Spiroplasma poulsonii]|uniref:Transmembrane protein n=1 Tax=Spiroplasma poulsonii TaxID=2138 RepID=A0A433ERW1_9MOLU|nr:hypothetical protein [Spiroplasma poulsonii]MBW3058450.1 hypothetical protein [Spiroplasma poulsonii]RUP77451.1 hypothetical protein D6D54_02455 [Spiroplasma poulsonii]
MYYSFDDILFKDYLDNSFLREWILNNRYAADGVFKFFLWMFIFSAFFLFTILSSWTFLHYKSKKISARHGLLNFMVIVGGISVFFFSSIIWNLVLVPDLSIDLSYYRTLLTGYSYVQLTITLGMIVNNRRLVSILLYVVYASPFIIIGPVIVNNLNNINRYDKDLFILFTCLVILLFVVILQLCGFLTRQDEKSNIIRFVTILVLFSLLNSSTKISLPFVLDDNIKIRQLLHQAWSVATVIADLFVWFVLMLYLCQLFANEHNAIYQEDDLDLIEVLMLQELNRNLTLNNHSKEEINPNNWKLKMLN